MPKIDTEHLASLVTQALQRDPPREIPAGPDGELIWQCDRMIAINKAIGVAYEVIPDDDNARDVAVGPLSDEWNSVQRHVFSLPPPRTRDGVRAAAEVMLSWVRLDTHAEAVENADLLMWLSRACAEYLAAPAIAGPADAALLDLCRQFDIDARELRRNDLLTVAMCQADPTLSIQDDDLVPLLDRLDNALRQITALPATTMAGVRAKAGALRQELILKVQVDHRESFEDQADCHELLAMSLLNDLAAVPIDG